MQFVQNKKYHRGKKTLFFIFIQKGWFLTIIGIGFIVLSWLLYFGALFEPTNNYLLQNPDLYVTPGMLALWSLLLGLSTVFVGFLRAYVLYHHYKFMLDEYALYLHRGLFFIKETTIPYKHISNVHIERPYHYRMFGIARLDIVTTAHSNPDKVDAGAKKLLVPIIDLTIARALSRYLLEGNAKRTSQSHMHQQQGKDFLEEDDDDEFEDDDSEEPSDSADDTDDDTDLTDFEDTKTSRTRETLDSDYWKNSSN